MTIHYCSKNKLTQSGLGELQNKKLKINHSTFCLEPLKKKKKWVHSEFWRHCKFHLDDLLCYDPFTASVETLAAHLCFHLFDTADITVFKMCELELFMGLILSSEKRTTA